MLILVLKGVIWGGVAGVRGFSKVPSRVWGHLSRSSLPNPKH